MTARQLIPRLGLQNYASQLKDHGSCLISESLYSVRSGQSQACGLIIGETAQVLPQVSSSKLVAVFNNFKLHISCQIGHQASVMPSSPTSSMLSHALLGSPLTSSAHVSSSCYQSNRAHVTLHDRCSGSRASSVAFGVRVPASALASGGGSRHYSSNAACSAARHRFGGSCTEYNVGSRTSPSSTSTSASGSCVTAQDVDRGGVGFVRSRAVAACGLPHNRRQSTPSGFAFDNLRTPGDSSGSSSGFSGRCFATGSWGPGGGSAPRTGSQSEDAGLPPPVIISPVALRVIVIGWMGSNRRYLNKYGALWARSGDHEVLMVRPTVMQTLVRWRGVVVAGRDIDRVAKMHRENPAMPTVYHVFSTGGFIHAGTMWRWMDEVEDVAQRRDLLEEVRGIILDSAPAAVNPEMSARAIVSAVTNTPAEDLSYGMPGLEGALLNGTRSFMEGYLRSKGVKLRTEEVYDAWYNLAPVCPQLYLYSDADPLVPASDVERYMAVQEGRGVEVSGYKWPDSGHVEHYRRHPHEYAYQISTFLARALRDW